MSNWNSKFAGVLVALCVVSSAAASQAYTFGRLKSVAGGTLSKIEPTCSAKVQENLEAWSVINGVEQPHKWGAAAKTLLEGMWLPTQIDDAGVNTCALYGSGKVSLWFKGVKKDMTPTAAEFKAGVWFGGLAENGTAMSLMKSSVCSGHNNWHVVKGYGGPGWTYAVWGILYKSG